MISSCLSVGLRQNLQKQNKLKSAKRKTPRLKSIKQEEVKKWLYYSVFLLPGQPLSKPAAGPVAARHSASLLHLGTIGI